MAFGMTCAQAKGIVTSRSTAMLRAVPATCDRYVRDGTFCVHQETARTAVVAQRSVDGVCRSVEIGNGP